MTRAIKPATLFICIVDYNDYACAVDGYRGEPHRLFDDACNDYVEARDDGLPAFVLRLNLYEGTHEDITGDAHDRIENWIHQRGETAPDWLTE